MEEKGWKFEKGNSPELPTVSQSEHPIPKEEIDPGILDYIYSKVNLDQKQLLEVSDFNLNFLCWGDQTAFLEINVISGNGSKIDIKLTGDDAKGFLNLINKTRFGEKQSDN
jgi:hypothetical protein